MSRVQMVTMVTMVTMVEPFCCVEHHIDSIRIAWIELVWSYFVESLGNSRLVPHRPVVPVLCQGLLNTLFLSSSLAHLLHGGGGTTPQYSDSQ